MVKTSKNTYNPREFYNRKLRTRFPLANVVSSEIPATSTCCSRHQSMSLPPEDVHAPDKNISVTGSTHGALAII